MRVCDLYKHVGSLIMLAFASTSGVPVPIDLMSIIQTYILASYMKKVLSHACKTQNADYLVWDERLKLCRIHLIKSDYDCKM